MPHYRSLVGSRILQNSTATITSTAPLDFLVPALHHHHVSARRSADYHGTVKGSSDPFDQFFTAIGQASLCRRHRKLSRHVRNEKRNLSASTRLHSNAALKHQRFDDRGRLIIETTGPKGTDYSTTKFDDQVYIDAAEQRFASVSRLPSSFFFDVRSIRTIVPPKVRKETDEQDADEVEEPVHKEEHTLEVQFRLLESVRQLEAKLQATKEKLNRAIQSHSPAPAISSRQKSPLTKQDYLNLVDLYFYSHNSRFSPESSDDSPTPIVLNDYSFELSADFTPGDKPEVVDDDAGYVSPLLEIEKLLKEDKLREIAVMQVFVDLLLDDESPNRALFEAYSQLPKPGVAYLPKGVIRLFLQRMSVPWVKTQAAMLRYLSVIDDMQKANLPINVAEWSSAIYLAGRSFSRIDLNQVARAFNIWEKMEKEAGVKSSNVTFNILFDIAVRSGKFALGETILTEMHKRNLRLNRMGRVSLMYYHGLRGDGDGVRKAYHDFVEAGEIVDTLVLNCVIASLINAQEPAAADQIYQRMRSMQETLKKGYNEAGDTVLFKRHPEPGSNRIDHEMAANELGRVLKSAPRLRELLPDNHQDLQNSMPLTPNFTTFRIMLAYHTTTSGDLNRVTVLLKEMLQDFDIPLFPVVFQLIFRGFAVHGPMAGSDSAWTKARLDMIWNACRRAVTDAANPELENEVAAETRKVMLPSITDINNGMSTVEAAQADGQPKARVLSLWEELVIDLAAFPRERLKRLQRLASTHFSDVDADETQYRSPFFENSTATYAAPQPELDEEEGEYTLPDPTRSTLVNPNYEYHEPFFDEDPVLVESQPFVNVNGQHSRPDDGPLAPEVADPTETEDDGFWDRPPTEPQPDGAASSWSKFYGFVDNPKYQYRLVASKPLVCWLLRAYSRMTNSRAQVEEVWGAARKIWRPKDDIEAQHVIRVLIRCLQDCDRMSGR